MGIRFGAFDPLQLIFGIMDKLLRKGLISDDDARDIIRQSLPPEMPEEEKDRIINDMVKKNP